MDRYELNSYDVETTLCWPIRADDAYALVNEIVSTARLDINQGE